jgi:hypothetical protein
MIDEHDHDHDHDDDREETLELELSTQSQIFLDMRQQNLDLLDLAAKVAGYGGGHGPVKPEQLQQVMRGIWDIYSEFYTWIDPEDPGEDEEDE